MPFGLASICTEELWKKRLETEPTSVLHMRRSPTPSPPTSASTFSSSAANGGAFATDAAAEKKEEWANELQPILVGAHHNRCAGLEDWAASIWPDPSTAAAVPEQSLLRWVAGGEIDESSLFGLKHLLQTGNAYTNNSNSNSTAHLDFEGNVVGLGISDQGSVLDPIGNLISGSGSGFAPSGFNGNVRTDPNFEPLASTGGDASVLGVVNVSSNACNVPGAYFSNLGVPGYHQQMQQCQFVEEKPQIGGNYQLPLNQNPNFFMPLPYNHQEQHHVLQPPLKRLNSFGSDSQFGSVNISTGFGSQFVSSQQESQFQQQQQPLMVAKQKLLLLNGENKESFNRQQQTILDQLYRAAELVGTGNFQHAQGILARLNHQLSPVGKQPLHRAACYFKDALQLLLFMNPNNNNPAGPNHPFPRTLTPFDVIFKMGAFKVFSDISPVTQFVNFTANQAILDALDSNNRAGRIHIVDFDIGFGVQWASFIQELAVLRTKESPALRITAVASPSIEIALARENLTQFASDARVSFELEVVDFEFLEQQSGFDLLPGFKPDENEFVAVNLPVWCCSGLSVQLHSLVQFVKHISPKIVVCLDKNCERSDLPFPQHILHSLQSYVNLMESLDAANASSDAVNKIERFILQPMIESTVLGRMTRGIPGKLPHWKTLLASAGFLPASFSGFAESQADFLVKRAQTRGFHIEKRQGSLVLCWMRRELVSASVWKC